MTGGEDGVRACVAAHRSWMCDRARRGGRVWQDGAVTWALVAAEGTLHAVFPEAIDAEVARCGVRVARELGARSVAVWSERDEQRPWLHDAGFEVGWQPWWMTLQDVGALQRLSCRHVCVIERPATTPAARTWVAKAWEGGQQVGEAWLHQVGEVAGLFDMDVRPAHQRRGLGRELVTALATTGAEAGVRVLALNATPAGAALYRTLGFTHDGEGRTWWAHLPPD